MLLKRVNADVNVLFRSATERARPMAANPSDESQKPEPLPHEEGNKGFHWDSEKEGLLNIPADIADTPEGEWMREHHNASHALWYFSMVIYSIIHGKASQNTLHKTERILAHLSHLREFISEKDVQGKKIVNSIFDVLLSEKPANHARWTHFIYAYWNLIWNFAERYGHHDKCFPAQDYKRICDVVHKRHYFRLWWWKIQLNQRKRFFRLKIQKWMSRSKDEQ